MLGAHKIALIAIGVIAVGGCATPMGNLDSPPGWTMTAPPPQPTPKVRDDVVRLYGTCRRALGQSNDKLRVLQRYARAVSGSK